MSKISPSRNNTKNYSLSHHQAWQRHSKHSLWVFADVIQLPHNFGHIAVDHLEGHIRVIHRCGSGDCIKAVRIISAILADTELKQEVQRLTRRKQLKVTGASHETSKMLSTSDILVDAELRQVVQRLMRRRHFKVTGASQSHDASRMPDTNNIRVKAKPCSGAQPLYIMMRRCSISCVCHDASKL